MNGRIRENHGKSWFHQHGWGLLQQKFGFWVILSGDTWDSPSYEKNLIKDQAYLSYVFKQTHKYFIFSVTDISGDVKGMSWERHDWDSFGDKKIWGGFTIPKHHGRRLCHTQCTESSSKAVSGCGYVHGILDYDWIMIAILLDILMGYIDGIMEYEISIGISITNWLVVGTCWNMVFICPFSWE